MRDGLDMELLANELSLNGKFHDFSSFFRSLDEVMTMRSIAHRWGVDVYCHRAFLTIQPIQGVSIQQALQRLPKDRRSAVFSWLARGGGPFWEDLRQHGSDDYLECRGEIVTDSAVGEAAVRMLRSIDCGLIGAATPGWDYSPIEVVLRKEADGENDMSVLVPNWRSRDTLLRVLNSMPASACSWQDLDAMVRRRFTQLRFSVDWFEQLERMPYSRGAADRIILFLNVLNQLTQQFDDRGERTVAGHRLYRDYFEGQRPIFTDSSDTEKHRFRRQLTFRHPDAEDRRLFCPWHGKMARMDLRLHFSWPVRAGEPLYVVYAGPKLTKV